MKYISLVPHQQKNPKYIKKGIYVSTVFKIAPKVTVKTAGVVNLSSMFNDHLKKWNSSYSNWNFSMFQTGVGVIKGQLQENNKPIPDCILHLIQSSTGVKAATTSSDKDGNFKFTGIAADIQYFVIAIHKKRLFNAVVLDDVRLDSRVNYDQSEV